jgi:drug/metabolite transporter (DMT)-like permease
MTYLALFILGSVAFNQCLRFGQKRGADILAVVVVNYAIAALASLVVFLQGGAVIPRLAEWPVLATACINGAFYFIHILFVLAAFRALGVGIANAVIRSGIIVPAVVAWLAWGEPMTLYRWIALALVPVSMILMRRSESTHSRATLKADLVLLTCFLMAGVILSIHKFAEVRFTPDQRELYKTALFIVAAIVSSGYALARRVKFSVHDTITGVVLGAVNALNLLLILKCLGLFPAVVFFPTVASIEICLNVLVSGLLWQERILRRQLWGLILAIGIVLLTNIRPR